MTEFKRIQMTVEEIMEACLITKPEEHTLDVYRISDMYTLDDINEENFSIAKTRMEKINRIARNRATRRFYSCWLEEHEGTFNDFARWQNQREHEINGINDSMEETLGKLRTAGIL